jgi:hypothetical protein
VPRGDEPLGDIVSVVLFENDRFKIWNPIVDPGEASACHLHERDYVTVVVEGGGLTDEYDDGTTERGSAAVGVLTHHGEHRLHRVVNNTATQYKNVLVELKS